MKYRKTSDEESTGNDLINFDKSLFPLLNKVLESNDFSKAIINGFKATGLYTFDANAIEYNVFHKAKKRKSADSALSEHKKALLIFKKKTCCQKKHCIYSKQTNSKISGVETNLKRLFSNHGD